MAITHVQTKTGAGLSIAFGSNVTSGNLLVVTIQSEGSIASPALTDTRGTVWSLVQADSSQSVHMAVYYGFATSTGANTVSGSWGSSYARIAVSEFSGVASASLDAHGIAGNTATPSVGLITTQATDLLYCACGGYASSNTFTAGTGFTIPTNGQSNGSDANAVEYQIAGAAGSYTCGITIVGSSGGSDFIAAAFAVPAAVPKYESVSKALVYSVLGPPAGQSTSKALVYSVLTNANTSPPIWNFSLFTNGVLLNPYSQSWDLNPAASPTTYSVVSGALPTGLSLTSPSGDIGTLSGTPTALGTFTFTLRAANAYGTADKAFSMTVAPPVGGGGSFTWVA